MTLGWSHDEQENSERGRWFTTGARGGGGHLQARDIYNSVQISVSLLLATQ